MESCPELWEWLNASQSRGIVPGLDRMERLLAALGNPERGLCCLHVAGTNGKGSVCAFAESILRAAGHSTGFYSSPHLVDFSERIRINGIPVALREIEAGIRRLQLACSGCSELELATYFELVTALAFDLFARAACDIVVLETGMGGRLDATNTAPKIACAITPIALDHTEWLGESLAAIAREKAGILRPNIPAVVSSQSEEVMRVLVSIAQEENVPLIMVNEAVDGEYRLGLSGAFQRRNAALALALVNAAGFLPSDWEVRQGLATVSWPGRFQRLMGGKLIVDGAHNLHAIRQLVETWHEEFGDQKCRLIFGALSDKNPQAMLSVLESIAEEIILVPVASPRSLSPEHYEEVLRMPYTLSTGLPEAMDLVFKAPSAVTPPQNIPVLLTGSLFLVGEALSLQAGGIFVPRSQ